MRKVVSLGLAILLVFLDVGFVRGQKKGVPVVLAVLPLQNLEEISEADAAQITRIVQEEFFRTGKFKVLERADVDANGGPAQSPRIVEAACHPEEIGFSIKNMVETLAASVTSVAPEKKEKAGEEIAKPAPAKDEKRAPEKNLAKEKEEENKPSAMGGSANEEQLQKKKFPWLIAAGVGLVVVVVAVLFLTKTKTGNIHIISSPAGAKVYLDDTDTGNLTPCTLTGVATGDRRLRLELENYGSWSGSVTVEKGMTAEVAATLTSTYHLDFVAKWGSYGSGDGQFNRPYGIAADRSGNIYVSDVNNERIQKFTSGGAFVAKWGNPGTGNGQLNRPCGLAFDRSGYLFVADALNNRIQRFSTKGAFIGVWGVQGTGDGQFNGGRGPGLYPGVHFRRTRPWI